jgi:hypothetical protein
MGVIIASSETISTVMGIEPFLSAAKDLPDSYSLMLEG